MFADPANPSPLGPALLTSIGAVIVAGIAGVFAWLSNSKSNRNAADIQEYKSATDRDLERLKAKLEHGQLISTTQWNAEFNAYQTLWKTMIPVRALATKLVYIDSELTEIGLVEIDFQGGMESRVMELLKKYADALTLCTITINEHAPFYAADIRKTANEFHSLGNKLHKSHTAAMVGRQKQGIGYSEQTQAAVAIYLQELLAVAVSMDNVEELIRKRMASVQVFNPTVV